MNLFDRPYKRLHLGTGKTTLAERRRVARSVAAKSAVLLKNEKKLLPLSPNIGAIAVLGPMANAADEIGGWPWAAAGDSGHVSIAEGIESVCDSRRVKTCAGVTIDGLAAPREAELEVVCAGSDVFVLCLGEAKTMTGEAASRARIDLPGRQLDLVKCVRRLADRQGARVITVLVSGRPLILREVFEASDAFLAAWFPGTEGGSAIADLLFGKMMPEGRTPITWPLDLGQLPIFYSQRPTGRPADDNNVFTSQYRDIPNEPWFCFGHGLSYADSTLKDLRVTERVAAGSDWLDVRVLVCNDSGRETSATVFLFIRDLCATVSRPVLELKRFAKVILPPAKETSVSFSLRETDFTFLGESLDPIFEAGEFEIAVGLSADRLSMLKSTIRLG